MFIFTCKAFAQVFLLMYRSLVYEEMIKRFKFAPFKQNSFQINCLSVILVDFLAFSYFENRTVSKELHRNSWRIAWFFAI